MTTAPTTPPNADKKVKPGRRLRWVLAASLALNLCVLGIVAGAMLGRGGDHRDRMVRELGFGPFTEALEPEDRAALRKAFFQRAPDFRKERAEMKQNFVSILVALRAEPFDAAALKTALDQQQVRTADRLAVGQSLITDHLTTMSAEARHRFADRLEDVLTRRR